MVAICSKKKFRNDLNINIEEINTGNNFDHVDTSTCNLEEDIVKGM